MSLPVSPISNCSRSGLRRAVRVGTCITIAATTEELQGHQRGPLRRASFLLASRLPSSPEYTTAAVEARQIWHGRGCCAIETESAGAMALPDFLLASQLFSREIFFMRRSFILADVAITITLLVALSARVNAQQPMQRVQVGV